MNKMLRDHPHLPLLSISQCLGAFAKAGIPTIPLHDILGYSRMTVYKWRSGKAVPYAPTMNRVSTLAYKCLRALNAGLLPLGKNASVADYQQALSDNDTRVELLDSLTLPDLVSPKKTTL